MIGDGHVPFRGSLGVKIPGATRLLRLPLPHPLRCPLGRPLRCPLRLPQQHQPLRVGAAGGVR